MATKKKTAQDVVDDHPSAEDLHEDSLPEEPIVMDPRPAPEMPQDAPEKSKVANEEKKAEDTPAALIVPEACFDETMPQGQRIDIFLSAEWDAKPKQWQKENEDKAGYMNEQGNRVRACEAIKQ